MIKYIVKVVLLLIYSQLFGETAMVYEPLHPLVDLTAWSTPYNAQRGFIIPSMQQAVDLNSSLYQVIFYSQENFINENLNGIYKSLLGKNLTSLDQKLIVTMLSSTGYLIWIYLPFGDIWLHENFHQAVLMNKGISSYNGIYDFRFFSQLISVSEVRDQDLASLKLKNNPDFVRLHSAGIEGQTEFVNRLDQDRFILGDRVSISLQVSKFYNLLNNSAYLFICASPQGTETTGNITPVESGQLERDIVGLDFTGWVYDLFRPNIPYSARPSYPDGSGIKRYITQDMLTENENRYLSAQALLSLLSFVDTTFFQGGDFTGQFFDKSRYSWNMSIRHYLTPFGGALHWKINYQIMDLIFSATVWNNANSVTYFPGLDLRIFRYPILISGSLLALDARIAFWSQPDDLSFYSDKHAPGGLLNTRLRIPVFTNYNLWVDVLAKSSGWVPGIEELSPSIQGSIGLNISM